MGAGLSLIQKASSPTKLVTDQLFDLMEKDITDFEKFHAAFLEVITKINAAMPGVHYDAPTREVVQKYYHDWKNDQNKNIDTLIKLLNESNLSKTDNVLLLTGVATPPAAMIGKKAAVNIPTLNLLKVVPDFVFVPTVTLAAVAVMKVARKKVPAKSETSASSGPKASAVPAASAPTVPAPGASGGQ